MDGSNLLAVLLSTIKTRFAAITSRIRLWTSWNFIQSRIITRIRVFFTDLLDVRPKNPKDYYTVFGWMISKRLAYAAVILTGVVSIWYIVAVRHVFSGLIGDGGIRTYAYDDIQLRFARDTVRITGKSGYLAYEGQVARGYANGTGTLYAPDGIVVYQGTFEKSRYEKQGTSYYPTGAIQYVGQFHENLYEGSGKLYREDGSLWYDGDFTRGRKNGEGRLCDAGGGLIFEGQFANDEIVYATFLGKSTMEVNKIYGGARRIWQSDDAYSVYMSDIGAIYSGVTDSGSLKDEVMVDSIYVLSDTFPLGARDTDSLADITATLGLPVYEGNSRVILPEAVSICVLNETSPVMSGPVQMQTEQLFSDVTQVNSLDENYSVYLTAYQNGGLIYTFVSQGRNDHFDFYSISKAEGSQN
ncbi:MAG: hypothetical protein IJT34_01370 [Butyrivibrio sp.]|nr:hypothetical protein [Butyrivibrio sp.]